VRGGTLYVVATPLGHLGDLTARASALLRVVPVVAAEDTRRSRTLLHHLGARPRLLSYHAHSGPGAAQVILNTLASGDDVALVTDAGTPGISDPGAALVAQVRAAGHPIVPLPGPSAVTTALSAAGFPADRYVFLGFVPRKGAERGRLLERAGREEWTTVFFEAPGRVAELLGDLAAACGEHRRAVVARELTKVHEEFRAGTLGELATSYAESEEAVRGECTVVLEGAPERAEPDDPDRIKQAATRLIAAGISRRETASLLAELFGVPRNVAYRLANSEEGRGKREEGSGKKES
jgi:16S rRNA (cytidine1402-2'-O)-methyltransferase